MTGALEPLYISLSRVILFQLQAYALERQDHMSYSVHNQEPGVFTVNAH